MLNEEYMVSVRGVLIQAHWLIYAVDSCLLLCGPQRKGPSPDFAIAVSRGLERIRCAVLGGREYTS